MKVEYLDVFELGNLQNSSFKSLNHLNLEQQKLIIQFVYNVINNKILCGRNKGSYYDKYNVFHYHIGYKEYTNYFTLKCDHQKCKGLIENTNGLTSEGVIYYIKHNSIIYILAFGEKHSPFPNKSNFLKILNNINI